MASGLIPPSAEQHCIIKFLVKEKVKVIEMLCRSNAQYGERPCQSIIVYG